MGNILGVGVTGLNAAQAGLLTTEHNIANASTPGYRRQETIQIPANPQLTGSGFFGQGVQVQNVRRIYSDFIEKQLLQAQTTGSYIENYYSQVKQIDNLMADPSVGLSPALQEFFKGINELASNPSSVPVRQSVLSTANALVSRFGSLNQRLSEMRSSLNTQLSGTVTEINSYAAQISALNDQISIAQNSASGSGQLPNDLLDQRDQVITELNKLVKVSVLPQSDGAINVFIGNGQPLVVGVTKFALSVTQSKEDPDSLVIGYSGGEMNASMLSGGTLGALLEFRSTTLDASQNALGRIAVALAQTVNDQHKLGVDLNGTLGTNFFSLGSNSPYVKNNTANGGSGAIAASYSATAAGALTTASYRLTYTGTVGAEYTLTNLSTNTTSTVATAAVPTAIPGLTLSASGLPNAGDSFLILPTRYAARDLSVAISDTSLVAAATPISTAATVSTNTGTASISTGGVTSVATLPTATMTLTYNSGTGNFTTSSTQAAYNGLTVAYTSGNTISMNGINFVISGAPANGDTFTVSPNYGGGFTGVSDGRNALAMGLLQTKNTMVNNGSGAATTTFQGAYGQLVSEVGNKTREMQVRGKAQDTLIQQTESEQQSLSGVNLDEEAAKMIRYQQAYQASGKAMQIASSLFQTLLNIGA